MLFSDAKGRKVVSTSTAETVGKVREFVVDPASRSVIAIHLKKAESGETLRWSDITGFGEDAVTFSHGDVAVDLAHHAGVEPRVREGALDAMKLIPAERLLRVQEEDRPIGFEHLADRGCHEDQRFPGRRPGRHHQVMSFDQCLQTKRLVPPQ